MRPAIFDVFGDLRVKPTLTAALLAATVILTGCEFSPHPISEAGDVEIREELLGVWEAPTDDDDEIARAQVFAFNETEYAVFYSDDEVEDLPLRVYESDLDGVLIANIDCFACDEDDWEGFIFMKFDVVHDRLVVTWPDEDAYEDLEDANSSREVRRYLKQRMREGDLFDDEDWIWTRVED